MIESFFLLFIVLLLILDNGDGLSHLILLLKLTEFMIKSNNLNK